MNTMFEKTYNYAKEFYERITSNVPGVVLVYLGVILAHYITSNMYPYMCCRPNLLGFIMTPFMVVTPHCEAMRWVIHYSGDQIRNVWIWLGGYLVVYFGQNVTPMLLKFTGTTSKKNEQSTQVDEMLKED